MHQSSAIEQANELGLGGGVSHKKSGFQDTWMVEPSEETAQILDDLREQDVPVLSTPVACG